MSKMVWENSYYGVTIVDRAPEYAGMGRGVFYMTPSVFDQFSIDVDRGFSHEGPILASRRLDRSVSLKEALKIGNELEAELAAA